MARKIDLVPHGGIVPYTYVESAVFTPRWRKRMDDAALRSLQLQISGNLLGGDPIPGCGLMRKARFGDASRGQGKRGGLRVVYMVTPEAERVDLLTVYGKDEAADLSPREVKELCELANLLRLQAKAAFQARGRRLGRA